jgi:hypothetical protein
MFSLKNSIFWNVAPHRLVKTDVSEERDVSIFRVEEIYAREEKC